MAENVHPTSLRKEADRTLIIEWSDGGKRRYSFQELRDACPCASCREARTKPKDLLPVLSAEETAPIEITGMQPVGTYAYAIEFSDGHNTGIYSYDLLLRLGQQDN